MATNLALVLVKSIPFAFFKTPFLLLRALASFWEIPLAKGAGDLDSEKGQ